jgi:hypothetical protein
MTMSRSMILACGKVKARVSEARSACVMPEVFSSHLDWSGAAKGPTRDPATFSRNLEVSIDAITLAMSAAPGFRGDAQRAKARDLVEKAHQGCFIGNSVSTPGGEILRGRQENILGTAQPARLTSTKGRAVRGMMIASSTSERAAASGRNHGGNTSWQRRRNRR